MRERERERGRERERERTAIGHCIIGSIFKKYKLQRYTETNVGVSRRHSHAIPKHNNNTNETKEKVYGLHMKKEVRSFYERNDFSRITTG